MTEKYRNHPIVIGKGIIGSIIVMAYFAFTTYSSIQEGDEIPPEAMTYLPLLFLLPALIIVYSAVVWRRSFITLEDDHAVAETWLLATKVKTIPYGKVASINEVRGIIGRLIGCTTLQININSSHNAARPEIIFTFKDDLAQYVSKVLKYGISESKTGEGVVQEHIEVIPAPDMGEPVYHFGTMDSVMFGMFGSSTWSILVTIFFGGYTIWGFFNDSSGGMISAIITLASGVLPMVMSIIRHGNFRIFRHGDKIRLIHGMATIYDTSFSVSKVNAVSIKRTLIARLLHKCCIEAEVVGINAQEGNVTPTVTLLIPEKDLPEAMRRIFPEFINDIELISQPKNAIVPHMIKATLLAAPWFLFMAVIIYCLWKYDDTFDKVDCILVHIVMLSEPVYCYVFYFLAHRIHKIGYDDTMFTAVTGVMDIKQTIMQYSKVQVYSTVASPSARKRGLAKAVFSYLSSAGQGVTTIGYFPEKDFLTVAERSVEQAGWKLKVQDVVSEPMAEQ